MGSCVYEKTRLDSVEVVFEFLCFVATTISRVGLKLGGALLGKKT